MGFGAPAQPGAFQRSGAALPDGSLVLYPTRDHPVRLAARATTTSPVPDWFTSRAGTVAAVVRGGRAMAFATVMHPGAGPCEIAIELLAADGTNCGTATLRGTGPCTTVNFGADRTLFGTAQTGTVCSWTWWTGLLR